MEGKVKSVLGGWRFWRAGRTAWWRTAIERRVRKRLLHRLYRGV